MHEVPHTMTNIDRILEWRTCASQQDVEEGTEWYPLARACAAQMSARYAIPLDVAAGVIAVLSPRMEWSANLQAADDILRAFSRGDDEPEIGEDSPDVEGEKRTSAYGTNIRKAWNIARTGEGFPRCNGTRQGVRKLRKCHPGRDQCEAREHLHGPKVCEFADTILGNLDGRVVDVWATRAADISPHECYGLARDDPRRAGNPGNRFHSLQLDYAEAASRIGESPAILQAIVWTCIRRTWQNRRALQTEIPF